jgi:biopolymer transport protein ExbB
MFTDKLYESLTDGGWILLPIFLVGSWALFLLFKALDTIGDDIYRLEMATPMKLFETALDNGKPINPVRHWWLRPGLSYRLLQHIITIKDSNQLFLESSVRIRLLQAYSQMEKGLSFVGVLASVAPLLGLLGTVDGMVATFETITRFGNSNPVLLADGISEALLTTQAGLLIAFPLLLAKNYVDDRISFLRTQLERLTLDALLKLERTV